MTTTTTKKLEDCYEPGTPDHARMTRILDAVQQHPKGATPEQVAALCFIEPFTASRRLNNLVKHGLIRRGRAKEPVKGLKGSQQAVYYLQ